MKNLSTNEIEHVVGGSAAVAIVSFPYGLVAAAAELLKDMKKDEPAETPVAE